MKDIASDKSVHHDWEHTHKKKTNLLTSRGQEVREKWKVQALQRLLQAHIPIENISSLNYSILILSPSVPVHLIMQNSFGPCLKSQKSYLFQHCSKVQIQTLILWDTRQMQLEAPMKTKDQVPYFQDTVAKINILVQKGEVGT